MLRNIGKIRGRELKPTKECRGYLLECPRGDLGTDMMRIEVRTVEAGSIT
jgi:hypothetical protein